MCLGQSSLVFKHWVCITVWFKCFVPSTREGDVLCKVVFDGGYDRLDKLEEDEEIHVHPQFVASLPDGVQDLLHDGGVVARVDGGLRGRVQVRVRLHRHCLVGVVSAEVFEHLVHVQRFA